MNEPNWHNLDLKETAKKLNSHPLKGIAFSEGDQRLSDLKDTLISESHSNDYSQLFLRALTTPSTLLMLVAVIISLVLGHYITAIVLLSIIAGLDFLIISRWVAAQKSLSETRFHQVEKVSVIRDGTRQMIGVSEIVLGELLILEEGTIIPADLRITESINLRIDESTIRGDSLSVEKQSHSLPPDTPILQRDNMAYAGTRVIHGTGKGIAVAIGKDTRRKQMDGSKAPAGEEYLRLFQIPDDFHWTTKFVLIAITMIFGRIWLATDYSYLPLAFVTMAVAAMPESTIALVLFHSRKTIQSLQQKGIQIRSLQTLTELSRIDTLIINLGDLFFEDELKPQKIFVNDNLIKVTPKGFQTYDREIDLASQNALGLLLKIGLLCNNAIREDKPGETSSAYFGDPLEIALLKLGRFAGLEQDTVRQKYRLAQEFPFDPERKLMSAVYSIPEQGNLLMVKGAPEIVLERSQFFYKDSKVQSISPEGREYLAQKIKEFASVGLKVIAFAYKSLEPEFTCEKAEFGLTLVGFVGFKINPKPEAKDFLNKMKHLGITTYILSGDNRDTLFYHLREIGMVSLREHILDAREFERIRGSAQEGQLPVIKALSRIRKETLESFLQMMQEEGRRVAMLGTNPLLAPVLARVNLPFTFENLENDLLIDSSQMILNGRDPDSLKEAFSIAQRYSANVALGTHLFSVLSLAQIFSVFLCFLFRLSAILLPLQLLWVNIVQGGLMNRVIYHRKLKSIVRTGSSIFPRILQFGTAAMISLGLLAAMLTQQKIMNGNEMQILTAGFFTLVLIQLGLSFSFKGHDLFRTIVFISVSLISLVLYALTTCLLSWQSYGLILTFSTIPVLLTIGMKNLIRLREENLK
ncbi:cation-transporting P-type ATPase [bacterium]|nr:cation-transporting P-type ATPase [bacterium]